MSRRQQNLIWPAVAAIVYVVFAVYLYRPHSSGFAPEQWLLPIGVCVAAGGCFLLSRRWVVGFSGSFLAGLVYGFGPFVLSLARFHETAVLLAAGIPWLFMPAAYLGRKRGGAVTALLSLLPFLAVVLFFRVSAGEDYRLFAAPVQAAPKPVDLFGFVAPLVMVTRTTALPGLYHVPVAALIFGLAMMFRARRYGILLILVCGFALAFSRSFLAPAQVAWLGISPTLWLSIPLVCLSVLAGVALGLLAGFKGGWIDTFLMRLCDVMLSFPAILVALLIAGVGRADWTWVVDLPAAGALLLVTLRWGFVQSMRNRLLQTGIRAPIELLPNPTDLSAFARFQIDGFAKQFAQFAGHFRIG